MAAWFHLHWLQIKMTSQTIKLPVPFDTIEVEFQMASGDIIWWPACVTSIHTDISGQNSLAAAELTYDAGSDNNNHFYEVEHGSVIIISQTSLRATSKSNTFNKNALLRWRFQVLRISWFTQLSWGYKVQTDCSEGTQYRRTGCNYFWEIVGLMSIDMKWVQERRIRDLGRLGSSPFIPIPGNGVKLLTNFPLALCSSKNVLSATRLGLLRHTSAVCLCGILYVRHTSAVYYTRGMLVR